MIFRVKGIERFVFSLESSVYARGLSDSGFRGECGDTGVPLLARMIKESSCFSCTWDDGI